MQPPIDKVFTDLKPGANTIILQGVVGEADKPGMVRLFATLDLNDYIDIPEGDVVGHHPLKSGLGTLVSVNRAAQIERGSLQQDALRSIAEGSVAASAADLQPVDVIAAGRSPWYTCKTHWCLTGAAPNPFE